MTLHEMLLTGFDTFAGAELNPSGLAAAQLDGQEIAGFRVRAHELPTEFAAAGEMVVELIDGLQPTAVICCGQAGGASELRCERLAVNLRDARRPDNAGKQPQDEEIVPGAPAAYWASVPVRDLVSRVREAGIPARISYSAGTYVCNDVFYMARHHVQDNGLSTRVGFIHVPCAPEQVADRPGVASMEVETIARGLRAAMSAVPLPRCR